MELWQGVQRGRGESTGFRDPSHRHAQVCPEKKGVPGQLSPSSKWYRTLSMPREALTTASPLSEIRCRPSSDWQDFEDICLSPSGQILPTPSHCPQLMSPLIGKFALLLRTAKCPCQSGSSFEPERKAIVISSSTLWPQSKLPATLLFHLKWSSDSRRGGPFRCRAPKSTTAQLRQHSL